MHACTKRSAGTLRAAAMGSGASKRKASQLAAQRTEVEQLIVGRQWTRAVEAAEACLQAHRTQGGKRNRLDLRNALWLMMCAYRGADQMTCALQCAREYEEMLPADIGEEDITDITTMSMVLSECGDTFTGKLWACEALQRAEETCDVCLCAEASGALLVALECAKSEPIELVKCATCALEYAHRAYGQTATTSIMIQGRLGAALYRAGKCRKALGVLNKCLALWKATDRPINKCIKSVSDLLTHIKKMPRSRPPVKMSRN